jgi:hypothetical protein
VLPFGWGAGQNVGDSVRGTVVKRRLLEVLEESVKSLENENKRAKADFYDIARQYF